MAYYITGMGDIKSILDNEVNPSYENTITTVWTETGVGVAAVVGGMYKWDSGKGQIPAMFIRGDSEYKNWDGPKIGETWEDTNDDGILENGNGDNVWPPAPDEIVKTFPDGSKLMGDGSIVLSEERYNSYGLDFPFQEGAYLDPNTGIIYYPDGSIFNGDGTPRGLYVTNADGSITVRSDVTDNGDGTYSYGDYTIFPDGTVTDGKNAWFPDGGKYVDTEGANGSKGNYWSSDGTCYTFYPGTGWVSSDGSTVGSKLPEELPDGTILYPNGDIDTSNGGGFSGEDFSGGSLLPPPDYKPPRPDPPISDSNIVYEDDHTIRYEDGTVYNKDDGSSVHIDDGGNVYQKNPDNTWESVPIQKGQPVSQDKPLENGNGTITVPGGGGDTTTIDTDGNNKPDTLPPTPDNKPNGGGGSSGGGDTGGGNGDLAGVLGQINKTLIEQRDILTLNHEMMYGKGNPEEGSIGDFQKKNLEWEKKDWETGVAGQATDKVEMNKKEWEHQYSEAPHFEYSDMMGEKRVLTKGYKVDVVNRMILNEKLTQVAFDNKVRFDTGQKLNKVGFSESVGDLGTYFEEGEDKLEYNNLPAGELFVDLQEYWNAFSSMKVSDGLGEVKKDE